MSEIMQNATSSPGDNYNETANIDRKSFSNSTTVFNIAMYLMSGPLYYSVMERVIAILAMIIMLIFGLTGKTLFNHRLLDIMFKFRK